MNEDQPEIDFDTEMAEFANHLHERGMPFFAFGPAVLVWPIVDGVIRYSP